MSEFDRYAADYRELLDRSVAMSGESGDYFAGYKVEVIRRSTPPQPGSRILEFGCGIGLLSGRLAAAFPECRLTGYDTSAESVERARTACNAPNAGFTAEPPRAAEFDLVVCANVLHHVPPQERPGCLRQMSEALAPGGRLVLFEHNPLNPLTRLAVARCPFDEGVVLLPRREAVSLCRGADLEVEAAQFIVFFPAFARALRPLEPRLGWLPAGAQFCVRARRSA